MKTPNGIMALCIMLYAIVVAVLCPILRKRERYGILRALCILPAAAALIHMAAYGDIAVETFRYLYMEALLPLICLLPGKSGKMMTVKSVASALAVSCMCVYFLVDAIDQPMVHNFKRCSYTESFSRMLVTMEREYCLNSWKKIDYDALRSEYLARVEEAEKNGDEAAYAEIITEVIYRYHDCHVSVDLSTELDREVSSHMAGNDYGLSLVRLDDGSVVAVLVEPDDDALIHYADRGSDLEKLGIHNGTQILTWDGRDIDEAIADVECIYPGEAFPVKSNEDVYRPMFLAGRGGDAVSVTFIDDDGNERSAVLKRIDDYDNRLQWAFAGLLNRKDQDALYRHNYTCMLDGSCGYLKVQRERFDKVQDYIAAVRKGYYPTLTDYYAGLIEDLRAQGMERLVIDLRNNGGGVDCCAGALASLFTDEKRHMVSFGYEDEDGYHNKDDLYIFPDGRYKDIPVVVLVNDSCVSAGDGLAKFLGECDNVTLMGITSSGGVHQNNGGYIYLTDDICVEYPVFLSLSADAEPLIDTDDTRENRIPLDVTIPMTKERAMKMLSFVDNSDEELAYAVAYLEGTEP